MRIRQLEADREALRKDIGAILAAAEKEKRAVSDEERARADAINADLERIETTIKLEERRADWLRHDAKPVDAAVPESKPAAFANLGEMLQAVHSGYDPRLQAASGMSEGVPSDGGFMVQTDFASDLTARAFATGILAARVRNIEIGPNSNGLKLTLVSETSRVSSRFGGIIAYWLCEAGTKTASKPTLRQWDKSLEKLIGLYYATDELIQDATALTSAVNLWFADEFGFQLDDAIYNGTGVGLPLGILNSPCLVTVAKETGQLAATIVAENIEKMYSRMPAGSLGNAVWHINQECWPQIFRLSHAVGTGGVPMFVPAGGLVNTPAGTLLGRPIVPIEHCAALGTVGDIAFCDWSQYLAIRKGGMQAASSIHVKFVYDETAFRFVLRYNGAPLPNSPLTPYKGSATVSPFVVLATRA